MIDIDEIENEIQRLEKGETNWDSIQKLSRLYVVRDHLGTGKFSVKDEESEFMMACDGVQVNSLLSILDEHMSIIQALYPKEYDNILNRIKELK